MILPNKSSYPHTYIGENSRDGLRKGEPCRIVGKRAGGYQIVVPYDKRVFIAAMSHVTTQRPKKGK